MFWKKEIAAILRMVNETFTVVSRIEQETLANTAMLKQILAAVKPQPGVAVSATTKFEKEK